MNRFSHDSNDAAASGDDRGQLVLVSGAAIVVALLTLLVVHMQFGFAGITGTAEASSLDDIIRTTEDAVELATTGVAGRYNWAERDAAVTDFWSRLNPTLTNVEHARPSDIALTTSDSATSGWMLRSCPDGPSRESGPCVAGDGAMIQEHAGETIIVAVLVDVRIAAPRSRINLTIAVRPD